MSTLLDNLSEKKQEITHKIIANLRALLPKARECNNAIIQFKQDLSASDSFLNFHSVVRSAMLAGKEPYQIYLQAIDGMDNEIFQALKEYIRNDEELTTVMSCLNFSTALEDTIIATKERLSLQTMYQKLSEPERETAAIFINSLKKLEALSFSCLADQETFKARLKNSSSADEVAEIENEIEDYNQSILSVYDTMLPFPEDDKIAGALIEFLEMNHHLRKIMTPFDFYEPLLDDILAARAKVQRVSLR